MIILTPILFVATVDQALHEETHAVMDLLTNPGFLQYVIYPLLIAVIGGLGWAGKRLFTSLADIKHQVKNDHTTNLRHDIDLALRQNVEIKDLVEVQHERVEKIEAMVERHNDADIKMANAMTGVTAAIEAMRHQMNRIESRLDKHLDHHAGG